MKTYKSIIVLNIIIACFQLYAAPIQYRIQIVSRVTETTLKQNDTKSETVIESNLQLNVTDNSVEARDFRAKHTVNGIKTHELSSVNAFTLKLSEDDATYIEMNLLDYDEMTSEIKSIIHTILIRNADVLKKKLPKTKERIISNDVIFQNRFTSSDGFIEVHSVGTVDLGIDDLSEEMKKVYQESMAGLPSSKYIRDIKIDENDTVHEYSCSINTIDPESKNSDPVTFFSMKLWRVK